MIRGSNNPTECTPVRLSQSLGEFASLVALQTAHPTAAAGSYAIVNVDGGDDLVYYYSESDSTWFTNTPGTGNTPINIRAQYNGTGVTVPTGFTITRIISLNDITTEFAGIVTGTNLVITDGVTNDIYLIDGY